ncbi:MAG TPA: hypothetical protein VMH37_00760 [Candidatus Binataceae bacterium]|nr:hypothetical protein [Candidatus Binataceae bacterium]
METTDETRPVRLEIEQLTTLNYFSELAQGIGLTLGMGILWGLEVVRNSYFRLLDRLNFKPRRKPASAFPPGRPKKRRHLRV